MQWLSLYEHPTQQARTKKYPPLHCMEQDATTKVACVLDLQLLPLPN
jgi:hypothetical protein